MQHRLIEYDIEFAEYVYHTPSTIDKLGAFWPLRAGRNIAKANYKVGPRMIKCFSIHYVLEGRVLFRYNGKQAVLGKGDLFCMFPETTYQYEIDAQSTEQLQMHWFAFEGPQLASYMDQVGITREHPYKQLSTVRLSLEDTIQAMLRAFRKIHTSGNCFQVMSLAYQLFSELAIVQEISVTPHKHSSWVERTLDFMQLHYTEGITVEDAARYAGVQRSHFSTFFSKQVGLSPGKYIQNLKMSKGAELLRETTYSITHIALTLGFPDLYSFTKAFRKHFGLSPSHYREQERNG